MIAQWMISACLMTTLLCIAAHSFAHVAPRLGMPRRAPWLLFMVASLLLPFSLSLIVPAAPPLAATSGSILAVDSVASNSVISGGLDQILLAVWGAFSLVMAAALVVAHQRTVALSKTFRLAELFGTPVSVSEMFGPVAIGFWRTRIVMPEWVLKLPEAEQRLVLRHELEHLRARDQFILAAGLLLVVVMPWNIPLWWQLRRLRIAMELDCDARVAPTLRDRPRYANLLLHARQLAQPNGMAPAFASTHSALADRLTALLDSTHPTPGRLLRWAGCAVVSLLALSQIAVPSLRPLFAEAREQSAQVTATQPPPLQLPTTTSAPGVVTGTRRVAVARQPVASVRNKTSARVRYDSLVAIDPAVLRERAPNSATVGRGVRGSPAQIVVVPSPDK